MKKSLLSVAGILSAAFIFSSAVFAADAGQIEAGNIYKAKNQTTGGVFEDPTNATCNNVVKLRVEIHNPGPAVLKSVKVAATLPTASATSHSSRVTVSSPNANPSSVSDTAGIKLDKAGKLVYIAGSAEYFDATGSRLGSISDSIVAGGATIPGEVGVSFDHRRYVQFQVKIDCPTKPPVENCPIPGKEHLPKDSKDCKETPVTPPVTPETPKTPEVPAELPQTGAAEAIASIVGLGALIASAAYYISSRRVLG